MIATDTDDAPTPAELRLEAARVAYRDARASLDECELELVRAEHDAELARRVVPIRGR